VLLGYVALLAIILAITIIANLITFTFIVIDSFSETTRLGVLSEQYLVPTSEFMWKLFTWLVPVCRRGYARRNSINYNCFVFFILTGLFGGIGIWSIFHQKKKRAIWSFSIGLIMIIIYLVVMFFRDYLIQL
ncbi:hypothetical protein ACFSUR_27665, partial [Halalkalibacter alkalisediminis]|uniref:hypothetical protein n=1 Tax=Halalkalibacter alkalisediminis TaxID=935616 RepID=UPI00362655F7